MRSSVPTDPGVDPLAGRRPTIVVMHDAPHAPWHLSGECVVALVRRKRPWVALPAGLSRMPGPALVMAVRYADSPVGPYVELAVGEPAHLGLRVGLCVTTMVVTSADSRVGGIVNWGFPKELGTLSWAAVDAGVELVWKERDVVVTSRPYGRRGLPALVPMRSLQRRADGPVVVPGRIRGWARPARVTVAVHGGPEDPLSAYAGEHWGLQVRGLHLRMDAARTPAGLLSSLRAPLQVPEPLGG
jgi:hypothetical protein